VSDPPANNGVDGVLLGVIVGGSPIATQAVFVPYRWSAAVIVTFATPALPIVNIVCCPALVELRLNVPPLLGLRLQFTGMFAENVCVAPDVMAPLLEGVMLTGGSSVMLAVPATLDEFVAVIVAVSAFAASVTVKVVF
jgi:hypothetical protein